MQNAKETYNLKNYWNEIIAIKMFIKMIIIYLLKVFYFYFIINTIIGILLLLQLLLLMAKSKFFCFAQREVDLIESCIQFLEITVG